MRQIAVAAAVACVACAGGHRDPRPPPKQRFAWGELCRRDPTFRLGLAVADGARSGGVVHAWVAIRNESEHDRLLYLSTMEQPGHRLGLQVFGVADSFLDQIPALGPIPTRSNDMTQVSRLKAHSVELVGIPFVAEARYGQQIHVRAHYAGRPDEPDCDSGEIALTL